MTASVSGKKRKQKEKVLTAKAERGTLKVKILRHDQRPLHDMAEALSLFKSVSSTTKTRRRRTSEKPQIIPDSPPRPRPNRKHVPIFYEPQFRQPIKRGGTYGSKSATPMTSSSDVSDNQMSSSMKESTSTSSMTNLSTSGSGEDVDKQSRTNPLFTRNDSDGLNEFDDLLPSFVSSGSKGKHLTETTTCAGLPVDRTAELPSALHQLASSSASYRLALDDLSTDSRVQPSTLSSDDNFSASSVLSSSASPTTTSVMTPDTSHDEAQDGLKNHRIDPFSALQTAIDHSRQASQQIHKTCEFGNTNKSSVSEASRNNGKMLITASVGPPAVVSPSMLLQNSLADSGIPSSKLTATHSSLHRQQLLTSQADETAKDPIGVLMSQPKKHISLNRLLSMDSVTSEDSSTSEGMRLMTSSATESSPDTSNDTEKGIVDLGPPPSEPPAFTIGNSLIGGGIELQPVVSNVNRNDFDWKLHQTASNIDEDLTAS